MSVKLKQTDTKDIIVYTATSVGKQPVDLTGATAKFVMAKRGSVEPVVNASAQVTDPVNGKLSYQLSETDTLLNGHFHAEFHVEFADGKKKTYPSDGYILVTINATLDGDLPGSIEENIIIEVTQIDQFKEDIEAEVSQQKTRVDDLIAGTPQPSEVVDARLGYPLLRDKLQAVDVQLAQKAPKITDLHYQGVAFDTSLENKHVSWTHCNVSYDDSDESFFVVYNAQNSHSITTNKTYARKKPKNGKFSDAILIADKLAEGISCKTQSSGICANGDYIAVVAHINPTNSGVFGTFVYRSNDKGLTWDDGTEILVGGNPVQPFSGDMSGFKRLSNGRIILWYWGFDFKSRSLYSDDNGFTWSQGVVGDGNVLYVTEPTFIELDNGVVVGYARDNVTNGTEGVVKPAWFLKSLDGGITWQQPIKSQSIIDMTNNNCAFIQHENSELVEIVYGSRFLQGDGLGSIFQSITIQKDLENDSWGKQYRIGTGNGIPTANDGDFGYFGAATDNDGTTLVFYYNGTKQNSNIYYLSGNPVVHRNDMIEKVKGMKNTSEGIELTQDLVLGSFAGTTGRQLIKRQLNGKSLFIDVTVASNEQLYISYFQRINGVDTLLGRVAITTDGTIILPSKISGGEYKATGSGGSYIVDRTNEQLKMTIDSSGKGRLNLTNKTTGNVVFDLNLVEGKMYPQVDKSIDLGTPTNRFGAGYFTAPVVLPSYPTTSRPTTGLLAGATIRDSTLNKVITYDGASWRDAMGTIV